MKDLFDISGKVALVTGGSSGIGELIAEGYVRSGVKTYIASRKLDVCKKVAKRLSRYGTCLPLQADLATYDGVVALANQMKKLEKKLHILVNNSGANWAVPFPDYPESGWDKVMNLNTKAVFFLTQKLTPLLQKASKTSDPARVITVASIDGMKVPDLETYAYSASKAATIHMTRVLAKKLAPKITVNAICPGPFESRMMAETIKRRGDKIIENNPMQRIGRLEDMAGVAVFLAGTGASYITGSHIPVDGGSATTR